jgi:hypothetical protein
VVVVDGDGTNLQETGLDEAFKIVVRDYLTSGIRKPALANPSLGTHSASPLPESGHTRYGDPRMAHTKNRQLFNLYIAYQGSLQTSLSLLQRSLQSRKIKETGREMLQAYRSQCCLEKIAFFSTR